MFFCGSAWQGGNKKQKEKQAFDGPFIFDRRVGGLEWQRSKHRAKNVNDGLSSFRDRQQKNAVVVDRKTQEEEKAYEEDPGEEPRDATKKRQNESRREVAEDYPRKSQKHKREQQKHH